MDAREISILRRFIICAFYQIGLSNEGQEGVVYIIHIEEAIMLKFWFGDGSNIFIISLFHCELLNMNQVTYFRTVKYNPRFRIIYSFSEKGCTQGRLPGSSPPQIEIKKNTEFVATMLSDLYVIYPSGEISC